MLDKTLVAIGGRPASGKSRLLAQLAQTGVYGVIQVDDISAHLWEINGARYFDMLGLSPCLGRTIRRRLLDRPDLRCRLREEMVQPTLQILRARVAAIRAYATFAASHLGLRVVYLQPNADGRYTPEAIPTFDDLRATGAGSNA